MRLLRPAVAALLLFAACSSAGDRSIVGPRHVPASSGAPEVSKVIDLGDLSQLPAKGAIATDGSDGRFVVGELVLIEGDDFGKLPTVSIGGRPTMTLARTKSGGIVARIPTEVAAGPVSVEVSHPDGRDDKTIELERYVATASLEAIHFALARADGRLAPASRLDLSGVKDLCFGQDGRAVYAAQASERSLVSVAMAAKGGPEFGPRYPMGTGSFVELACRAGVPTVAVLDTDKVTFFDSRVPLALSRRGAVPLPDGAVAAALSPDGESLAVLGAKGNRMSLVSVKAQKIVATLTLLDNETVSLLRDLVFSPAGDEIWVLTGNSAQSIVAGTRPTQIHQVAVHGISLSRTGSATIGAASGPRYLAASQREAVMAASTVRSTASRATLLLTTVSAAQLSGKPQGDEAGDTGPSALLRFDLEGKATPLVEGTNVLSRAAVSHDQKWGYAAARSADGLLLVHTSLTGGASETVSLGVPAGGNWATAIPLDIAP